MGNKAIEKCHLWKMKAEEDRGSRTRTSIKTADGAVKKIVKIPDGANVTSNNFNKYEKERERNLASKENHLNRLYNGKDPWSADALTDGGKKKDVPSQVRPIDVFSNPSILAKIAAES